MQGESPPPAPGVVELREDVPLKGVPGGWGTGAGGWCAGGPRLVLACFGALTTAITLALSTQIYSGDYEVVPHGSVSSNDAACSRAGTDALKAGGRALDAAAAAALCLAVVAPHTTSLDASGSLVYWEYRQLRTQQPWVAEWGGAPRAGEDPGAERPPRLVAALATLHAELGALPWAQLLQPAIDLARKGFLVSESLASALSRAASDDTDSQAPPVAAAGAYSTAPQLAAYLESLQRNTSAELAGAWGGVGVRRTPVVPTAAGAARVLVGGARADLVRRALTAALDPQPTNLEDAETRAVRALAEGAAGAPPVAAGPATGLAVVDRLDTYLALVTGLSVPFGSGPVTAEGWTRDSPATDLDLAPAIITEQRVCGTRYVAGGESSAALAQAGAALAAGGGAPAVERARLPQGPAVNTVQQTGDELVSHADSRGGGLASRF